MIPQTARDGESTVKWQLVTNWLVGPVVIPEGAELTGVAGPPIVVTWAGHPRNAYGLSTPDGELGEPVAVPLPIPPSVKAMDNEAASLMIQWWPTFPWEPFHFGPDVDISAVMARPSRHG